MIRYTLACESGHGFESWFPSSGAYDDQLARGLVTCPVCDSHKVGKTLMAPAVARTDRDHDKRGHENRGHEAGRAVVAVAGDGSSDTPLHTPVQSPVPMIAEPERRLRALLRAMREQVVRDAEHVGARFPDEARAMHVGDVPARAIYGEASLEEARALIEEGIEVAPLPPAPDDRH